MTIKGSLQVSITSVKAFLTRNFKSRRKLPKNLRFAGKWSRNVKFCFRDPSLRETASFDVLIVKIGAGVLAVGGRKNQKQETHQEMR